MSLSPFSLLSIPPWTNQDLVLYHGTLLIYAQDIFHHGVRLEVQQPRTDFGLGFYTSTNREQAVKFIRRRRFGLSPVALVEFRVERERLASLNILSFVLGSPAALDFWSFVQHCRSPHSSSHGRNAGTSSYYDVVVGPVAKNWGTCTSHFGFDQVSFHTPDAVNLLNTPGSRRIIIL